MLFYPLYCLWSQASRMEYWTLSMTFVVTIKPSTHMSLLQYATRALFHSPACAAVCREWQMLHNQRLEIIQSAPGFCDSWRISNYILWTSFLLLFITMWFPLFCVNLISVWWSSVPLTITRVCCCGYFWTFWAHMSPAMMIISIYSPQFLLLDTQECFIVGTWDSF